MPPLSRSIDIGLAPPPHRLWIKSGADMEAVVVGHGTVRAIRSAEKTNIGLIQERLGEKLIRGEARYCDREAKRVSF